MISKAQLCLANCFLAVCVGGRHINGHEGSTASRRRLAQLSFSIPSSAIPGLLGLVSPSTPSPPPIPQSVSAPASSSNTAPAALPLATPGATPFQALSPSNATASPEGRAAGPSTPATSDSNAQQAPGSGIMSILPSMENNLMQRMRSNQKDDSNVHGFNMTVGAATSPAQGPTKMDVSQQLGNSTAVQEGPSITVDVHVDPVITVNGGVHISANGTQAMPLLANLLPPGPSPSPPPPAVIGQSLLAASDADDSSVAALPPVSAEKTAAFNAALAPEICGGGTLPYVACPPATQPYMQSLYTKSNPNGSPDGSDSKGLGQSPSAFLPVSALPAAVNLMALNHPLGAGLPSAPFLDPSLNNTQQDSAKILAAVTGAAQAVDNLNKPGSNAASPSGSPAGSTSQSTAVPTGTTQTSPGSRSSPGTQYGAVYPQSGALWPGGFDASSNWALILTATSSTITCVAVIFLVLLFLVFRMGGCRAGSGKEAHPGAAPNRYPFLKGGASSVVSQDSPCKRLHRPSPGRERRLRMLRFLDRRTSTISPAQPPPWPLPDVEKGAPMGSPATSNIPLRNPSITTSQDALLAPRSNQQISRLKSCLAKTPGASAVVSSGPMPLPSPFASRQEQGVTGSPGTESPGIAPSPFASRDVQAPFSSPPPSAASTASGQHSSSGFASCL